MKKIVFAALLATALACAAQQTQGAQQVHGTHQAQREAQAQREQQAQHARQAQGAQQAQSAPQPQAIPAQAPAPGNPFFTGDGGRGMTLAVLEPSGSGLSEDQMRWMPPLVQGSIAGDINMYSAITVIDRQNLETILDQQGLSMTGHFSDEDFIRIGHLANAHYVLAGSITRTAAAYMLELAVTNVQTGVRRASHPPAPVSAQNIENLSAVREATANLLGQLGVSLTGRARQELARTIDISSVQAQTALARGITAQRDGFEVEALSHFIQAAGHDPWLLEAESRLESMTASLARPHFGTGAAQEIAWRRQWMERLQETEEFFASATRAPQPYFLVYYPGIREGAINHANETIALSIWMALVPDPSWASSINQVTATVASSLRATGRTEAWGLNWPYNHVSVSPPFANRANNISAVVEIANERGASLGRQTVSIPAGFDIHARVSQRITPRQWEGFVNFPAVDVSQLTDRLSVRVVSIDGIPAEAAAAQRRVSAMSSDELFRATRIRMAPVDTSAFVVNANGVLTQWNGSGTEVDIPFMVNGVRVTAIGNNVFDNRGLIRVNIPDSVRSIGNNAFRGNNLASVVIPGSVATIGQNTFNNNQLTNIVIPDSVREIGRGAFQNHRLTTIAIPDSVTTIGQVAFNCGNFVSNVTNISIGANVLMQTGSSIASASFGGGFPEFYNQNGRRAGTYRVSGNTWTFTPR